MYTVGKGFADMYKMFDLADEHKQSWHGWMYKPYGCIKLGLACDNATNHSGGPGEIVVENTTRTYPQAVAGNTISYKFDKDSKDFSLSYKVNSNCKSSRTEIYYNKAMHYPNGFTHDLTPSDHVKMSISTNGYLIFLEHDNTLKDGDVITFKMSPK